MDTLDPIIKEYAILHKQGQDLLESKAIIDKKLKALKPKIFELSNSQCKTTFSIEPKSDQERKLCGETGCIQVRVKNDYERITRDKLIEYCIRFFGLLFPEESKDVQVKMGLGQADWIWSNRTCNSAQHLERVYPRNKTSGDKLGNTRKRLRTTTKDMVSMEDVPRTKEEFEKLTIFKKLQTLSS
jgi:hypothetical protein